MWTEEESVKPRWRPWMGECGEKAPDKTGD